MGKSRITITLLFLGLAAIACLGSGTATEEVFPTTAPKPTTVASDDGGFATVRLNNESESSICYVFISSSGAANWGEDWLGDEQIVSPGSNMTFSVAPGQYDLMATDCDENPLYEEYNITLPSSGFTWNVTGETSSATIGDLVTVTVINDTDTPLCHIFFGPGEDDRPNDLLGNTRLAAGDSVEISDVPYGVYCTQTVECNGDIFWETCEIEFYNGYRFAHWVDGVGSDIEVTNDAGVEICDIFFSLPSEDTWGADFLGNETLAIGEVIWIDVGAAGYYDILMQDCSGNAVFQDFGYIGPETTLTVYYQ